MAEFLLFLKSIPKLVEAINKLADAYNRVQIAAIENSFNEKKQELEEIAHEIKNATDNDTRLELVKRLSKL